MKMHRSKKIKPFFIRHHFVILTSIFLLLTLVFYAFALKNPLFSQKQVAGSNDQPSQCTNGMCKRTQTKEGGFCGGIAGIICNDGFRCLLDGPYPDAGGQCIKNT